MTQHLSIQEFLDWMAIRGCQLSIERAPSNSAVLLHLASHHEGKLLVVEKTVSDMERQFGFRHALVFQMNAIEGKERDTI